MKRLLAFLLLSISAFATTTFTGHVATLGTTPLTTGTFVRFWLRGCGGNIPRVGAASVIGPSQGGVYFFDFVANGSGDVSGTLYSNRDAAGTGDGEIECGGSHTATWYGMQIFRAGKGGAEMPILAKDTDTFGISNITPITTAPVVTAPSGDTTYARLDGGNQPFTGSVMPSGNGTLNLGGSSNRWNGFFNTLDVFGAATLGSTLSVAGTSTFHAVNETIGTASTSYQSPIFKSSSANPASAGIVRLAASDTACWRNQANSGDVCISKNSSDRISISQLSASRTYGGGTSLTTSDYILVGGWGSGASTSISGTDTAGHISVTAGSSGTAANPDVFLTFHDGAWSSAPYCVVSRAEDIPPIAPTTAFWTALTTSTDVKFVFVGTPTAGNVYLFNYICVH